MKKLRRFFLLLLSSGFVFLATGCKSNKPVTKYGVQYQTRYGVPANYMMKKDVDQNIRCKQVEVKSVEKHA